VVVVDVSYFASTRANAFDFDASAQFADYVPIGWKAVQAGRSSRPYQHDRYHGSKVFATMGTPQTPDFFGPENGGIVFHSN